MVPGGPTSQPKWTSPLLHVLDSQIVDLTSTSTSNVILLPLPVLVFAPLRDWELMGEHAVGGAAAVATGCVILLLAACVLALLVLSLARASAASGSGARDADEDVGRPCCRARSSAIASSSVPAQAFTGSKSRPSTIADQVGDEPDDKPPTSR